MVRLIEQDDLSYPSLARLKGIEATYYHVSSWTKSANTALDAALAANANRIEGLHAAVAANYEFDAWLAVRAGAGASDVVAVGLAPDGTLMVFIK